MRVPWSDVGSAVAGSSSGDRLGVSLWRGGACLEPDLPVARWSLGWDAGRLVQGQATVVVADPSGRLAPWSLEDGLSPGGSVLELGYVFGGGLRVPLGRWRVRSCVVEDSWSWRERGDGLFPVPGGVVVEVRADELTAAAGLARLDAAGAGVGAEPTCLSEIRRLLAPWMGVVADPGVVDLPLPAGFEWGEERLDAVDSLLAVLRARARMGGDGSFQVVPSAPGEVVWEIRPGAGGTLCSFRRVLSDDGLANRVVSYGEAPDGSPLVGRADALAGSWLDPAGDLGPVPVFHESGKATRWDVREDARLVLADLLASSTVDVEVACLANPAVQLWDRVGVLVPVAAGVVGRLEGDVVGVSLASVSGPGGVVPGKSMGLTVRVSADALARLGARARG